MKINIKLFALITVLLFSSCSTSTLTVMKRKYNSGYYVDFGKNKKVKEETPSAKTNERQKDLPTNVSNEKSTEYVNDLANEKIVLTSVNNINNLGVAQQPQTTVAYEEMATPPTPSSIKKPLTLKEKVAHKIISKKIKKETTNEEANDQTILLVILSLFPILALIAIYIKDGKTITTNFWIDLLLHFIGLWWLFALLVVLDIINLA